MAENLTQTQPDVILPVTSPTIPTQPQKGRRSLVLMIVIHIVAAAVIGYFIYQNIQLQKQISLPQPTPTPVNSGLPLEKISTQKLASEIYSTENWNTYLNKDKGYSYKYPPIFKTFSDKIIETVDFNWFFSDQTGLDTYRKCILDEEQAFEGGCLYTNDSYIFDIVISSSSISEPPLAGVTYGTFPNWIIGELRDSQGQGSGLHAYAYTTVGTENYTVFFSFPNTLNTEKYLKNHNYSSVSDLFTTILSTFKFTQ